MSRSEHTWSFELFGLFLGTARLRVVSVSADRGSSSGSVVAFRAKGRKQSDRFERDATGKNHFAEYTRGGGKAGIAAMAKPGKIKDAPKWTF